MIAMVGDSQINHQLVSECYVHLVSIYSLHNTDVDFNKLEWRFLKRKTSEYDIEIDNFERERIKHLLNCYTKCVYLWNSDEIRDLAFEAFLRLSVERMMPLLVGFQHSTFDIVRELILEPFFHRLVHETEVIERIKNLKTGNMIETFRLGSWKTQNVYESHLKLITAKDVINVSLKKNEAAVNSVVSYDEYCFQITVEGRHDINRLSFHTLMKMRIFDEFIRCKKIDISFVFITKPDDFANFNLQYYHGFKKESYAEENSDRIKYSNVTQYAFEIDLKRLFQFKERAKKDKIFSMTTKSSSWMQKLKLVPEWKSEFW